MLTRAFWNALALQVIGLVMLAAWVNHIVVCFNERAWGFLFLGAALFPMGIIHGAGVWLGFWV